MSGQLLLTGTLGYFLYLYSSMALGASYNRLFLLYIVIFSASLFAFIQLFSSVNLNLVASQIPAGLPRRGLVIFMFAAGFATLVVWGAPLVAALIKGGPPDRMDSYTTIAPDRTIENLFEPVFVLRQDLFSAAARLMLSVSPLFGFST